MKLFNTLLFTLILIVSVYIITSKIKKTQIEKYENIVQGDTWSIDDVKDNTGVKTWSDWEINYSNDPNNNLPSCNNYLNMTNNTSIDVTNKQYKSIDNKNLDDINNVRRMLYGNNKENLDKDEYTMCNLNLCVHDDGLPNKKEIVDYDTKIKNYFEQIQALEDFKTKIAILIIDGYIPFLGNLLLLVGTLMLNNNIKIFKSDDQSIVKKLDTVFNKSQITFLDVFNNWINSHPQSIFLKKTKATISNNIKQKANKISNTTVRETKLLSLSILDTPDIRNKLSDATWETKLLYQSNIYSDIKSFFISDYFSELRKKIR